MAHLFAFSRPPSVVRTGEGASFGLVRSSAQPLARLRCERSEMRTADVCLPKHFVCELPHLVGSRRVTAAFATAGVARFGPRSALPGTWVVHATSRSLRRAVSVEGASVVGSSPRLRPYLWRICRPSLLLARILRGQAPWGRGRVRPALREKCGLRATRCAFRRRGPFRILDRVAFATLTSGQNARALSIPDTAAPAAAVLSRAERRRVTPMQASKRPAGSPPRPLRSHPFARRSPNVTP
jgi:hypothetical protein